MRLVVSQEKVETAPFQDVENLTTQFQDFNSGQFYQLDLTDSGCNVYVPISKSIFLDPRVRH